MRLRLKLQEVRKVLDFGDNDTKSIRLDDLRCKVKDEFGLEIPFDLSLNKTDVLEGEDTALDEFGIVAGDLIHVIAEGYEQVQQELSNTENDFKSDSYTKTQQNASGMDTDSNQPSTSREEESMMQEGFEESVKDDPVVNRCLREPMQCCEATDNAVPALLSNLFKSANSHEHQDLLWVVIHTLMLESGLVTVQGGDPCSLPDNWKQAGFYNTKYRLPESGDVKCSVTGVRMGSFLVVHGVVVGQEDDGNSTFKCNVKTAEFVRESRESDAANNYKNLRQLSRSIKNQICLPLLREIRSELGYPEGINLFSLTHELKLKILGFLDVGTLLRVDRTCQHFHSLARDKAVWRRRYLLDFGSRADNSLSQNWYEMYKCQFVARKAHRKALRDMTFLTPGQVWMQPRPNHPFAPYAPYNGGIIGGDYDLNPQFQGIPDPLGRRGRNPLQPVRPRIDPFGPLPDQNIFHAPGRGSRRGRGWMGGFGGPRFF